MGALLARLIDDAALCPPRRAPMSAAPAAHRTAGRDRQALERTDAPGLAAKLLALTEAEAVATRRLLLAISTPEIGATLATLPANPTG